ncbi:MAG: fructan hydrolase [Clostridia bacterium]
MWVAVNKDNTEICVEDKPSRVGFNDGTHSAWRDVGNWFSANDLLDHRFWRQVSGNYIELPKGTIKKLTGKELTWEDEPLEITHYDMDSK